MKRSDASRLASLDALRGFAALAVAVFSHYQHWGGQGDLYPLYTNEVGRWLYTYSHFFVDLFFVLSGIVLTRRYLEPLVTEKVFAPEFFWLRFSRLYPLHFVTLCVCAAVEWTLMAQHKPTVIYDHNDLYHFILHATYLHSGWFGIGNAYNMPSWSVCSEVVAYAMFFVFATKYKKGYGVACLVAFLIGMATLSAKLGLPLFNENMARGIVGFFFGALFYLGLEQLEKAGHGLAAGVAGLVGFVVLWAITASIGYDVWIGKSHLPFVLAFFPLAIVAALNIPPITRFLSLRPFTFLGDISYAVYLVHVPVQMVTLVVARERKIDLPINSLSFLVAYGAMVTLVATAAHYGIELPSQRWLRARQPGKSRNVAPIAAASERSA